MAGYAPVFDSIYTGTLYGRWPAAAVWASLLPLFDRHGELDMSLEALCGMTGWPRDLLEKGIQQLMEPDPGSRTQGHEGRRMIPIDPNRTWGWRAVNHCQYREKARLMAKNAREVEEGKNAQRLADRRGPPPTAPHTHTQSHTKTKNPEDQKGLSKNREDAPAASKALGGILKRAKDEECPF